MVQSPSFTFDEKHNFMCLDTGRIIVGDKIKYLTALLNSSLFFFAVKYFYGGGGLGQSGVRMKHTFFEKFHAIVPTTYDENYVNSIVEQIILNQESINKNIFILDQYFFEIYNLNKDEINFILNSI